MTAATQPASREAIPVSVERHTLPPIPSPAGEEIAEREVYATATAGDIHAEVIRGLYWDPRHKDEALDVYYEALIDGLPDTCGMSDICAVDSESLLRLAAVCEATAVLLDEVKR